MNKNLNKPNKKLEISGLIMFVIGIAMILLRVFVIKEMAILVIGIILLGLGAYAYMMGKVGFDKTVEITNAYDIAKSKAIAKAVKEGLKDEDK